MPANDFNALSEKSSELYFSGRVDEHRKASAVNVAWWNVENLFDTEKSRSRSAKLKRVLRGELAGWTAKEIEIVEEGK